ncbi:PREDICTED: glycerophosphodiester phosphodiesterase protein kinase domain-containing GDPDL2-like isoform X2 [Populus euphratica]|uniref:Glycerophosphodiester phosphodiesterase protein kinase domain-containing GDPDL2-like isoform X2 n=1 Tax=Populus euphratica TaxID=75702 RepID=A0AAJ6UVP6_POPEU|nr:PREDICTED: glycerophosphodiester phosphodiesterase protein kinase domain-containing GDPDL2-like isoform X2 [Populus euphratica]
MMNYSSEMVTCLSYFFIVFLTGHGASLKCTGSCGNRGPDIRFPFRIKDKQPDHCGYPGFDLSCSDDNSTVLRLPTGLSVHIERIDYRYQLIYARGPQGCFLRQRLNFSFGASHFQIKNDRPHDWTLFNCSLSNERRSLYMDKIPCLSTFNHEVHFFRSSISISNSVLLSCTKMYNIYGIPYSLMQEENYVLTISWSNPTCGSSETECYSNLPHTKGIDVRRKLLITGVILGFFLFAIAITALYRTCSNDKTQREYQARVEMFLDNYRSLNPTRYSYADLKRITNQFSDELGQGAYGTVFKGKLTNEIAVAVKLLNNSIGKGEEFINEVGTMARIHHVNVVRLIAFCADGFRRALVYEYLPNDSLQKFISSADSRNHFLGWERLNRVALGIAKGIEYLHQGCDQRILHFDIKPQNILLDNEFNPKIADFGMAKLCSKDKSAISMTTARGTVGYIAPEVFSRNFGNVSYKSDVYSFGMLVLEMVGGRKNVDDTAENGDQIYFPEWIYNLLEKEEDLRFHIDGEEDARIAKKLAIVGLWCIQWNPAERPSMKTVVQMLEGEGENLSKPPDPFSSSVPKRTSAGHMPARGLHQELAAISEIE